MHRDLKLGLALAVLLIGATTAFFFRTETDLEGGLPQLQNPERLDAELAGRVAVPYLGAPETDSVETATASPWSKPAFLGGGSMSVRRTSATPDPIRILLEEEAELMGPGPELLPAPVTEPESAKLQPVVKAPAAGGVGESIHVVQPGDTLSGLATRYLGDVGRFGEIYELNRDRMTAPDALRIGMEIRIPAKGPRKPAAEPPGPVEPDAVAETAPSSDHGPSAPVPPEPDASTPEAEKMFVPARKTPFIPSRYRSGGVPSAAAENLADPKRE